MVRSSPFSFPQSFQSISSQDLFFLDGPPLKQDGNREYRANLKPHDTKLVKDFEAALSREGLVSRNTVILLNEATSHWDTETGNPLVGA